MEYKEATKNDENSALNNFTINKIPSDTFSDSHLICSSNAPQTVELPSEIAFKKPISIIRPIRTKAKANLPSKTIESAVLSMTNLIADVNEVTPTTIEDEKVEIISNQKQQCILPYTEPVWGNVPSREYKVEVLKSGVIIEVIDLTKKSFYVIGRLPTCDISLTHPTISRYHAVFQYRVVGDKQYEPGYYLYDLDSTHGTFWNGNRIKSRHYIRLHGGHMVRFGGSQRKFILHTPSDEEEEELEYSVTELKEMRRLKSFDRKTSEKEYQELGYKLEEIEDQEDCESIDWGMSEDADEETDMTENPYAITNNEELFLNNPKKTLQGWFERKGLDMQYHIEERGIGKFSCWIELPINNVTDKNVRVETLVKGKKKESVVQCALEACRILDRQGLLRQASFEKRKRKVCEWAEKDYYDSDEDNFLDRTGTIERKREQRMKNAGKLDVKAETHVSLIEKHLAIMAEITKINTILENHEKSENTVTDSSNEEDALDTFMSNLNSVVLSKRDITKMKVQLQRLHLEKENLKKLIDIVKPNLPSLNVPQNRAIETSVSSETAGCSKEYDRLRNHSKKSSIEDTKQYELIRKENTTNVKKKKKDQIGNVNEYKTEKNTEIFKDIDNKEKIMEISETDEVLKKPKRIEKKIEVKTEKTTSDVWKSYGEDSYKDDYSMWVPPANQNGNGKTSLNDKLGY